MSLEALASAEETAMLQFLDTVPDGKMIRFHKAVSLCHDLAYAAMIQDTEEFMAFKVPSGQPVDPGLLETSLNHALRGNAAPISDLISALPLDEIGALSSLYARLRFHIQQQLKPIGFG